MTRRLSPSAQPELPLAGKRLSVAGLFAGIGGIECGLALAGHHTTMLCELDDAAVRVLERRFPDVPLVRDVRDVRKLPKVDLVVAGFPCQDLSQAGRLAGITGARSGLVGEVFRLVAKAKPEWLLLENVSNMLAIDGGRAMAYLADSIESLGYRWAYRLVDARAFGLPQRRQRVLFLASRKGDPRNVLLADEAGEPDEPDFEEGIPYGFYWTEGNTGLGWVRDAIPTLKGGSTLGIPSPPAIWMPDGRIVTPHIQDAERLQGFPPGWTECAVDNPARRNGPRWKLVGNAVPVHLAEWVGNRLRIPGSYLSGGEAPMEAGSKWPKAAWGDRGRRFKVTRSAWPMRMEYAGLRHFLHHPGELLSAKATDGFLKRLKASRLHKEPAFLRALERHSAHMHAEKPSRLAAAG